jgi:hypothetical protein
MMAPVRSSAERVLYFLPSDVDVGMTLMVSPFSCVVRRWLRIASMNKMNMPRFSADAFSFCYQTATGQCPTPKHLKGDMK